MPLSGRRCSSLLWIAMLWVATASGAVRLPRLVSDGMVLQRDAPIVVWGWADRGEVVSVAFLGQHVRVTTGGDGKWTAKLKSSAAGGPYSLTVSGNDPAASVVLHDVLVGDVWVASGQSNMVFPITEDEDVPGSVRDAEKELNTAHFPQIRLFKVSHQLASTPQHDLKSESGWQAVTPTTVGPFSAVAYLFGRELHQRYHVPTGLIEASQDGTPAEAWMSVSALQPFPDLHPAASGQMPSGKNTVPAGAVQWHDIPC